MNTKKLLLAIMAFVIPIFSFAYIIPENGDRGVKIGDLYYFLYEESKTATVVRGYYDWEAPNIPRPQKFYDYTGDIVIPENVIYANDTYTVTSIEGAENEIFNFGFSNTSITSIVIPKTIETIGDNAFYGCVSLKTVRFEGGKLKKLGNKVFQSCSSLKEINIPESIESIGSCTFAGCNSLTNITIPDNVTSIGYCAFASIGNLTDVTIYADNVPETDVLAFENTDIGEVILHVPAGSAENYKNASPWKDFKEIVEISVKEYYTLTYKVDGEVYKTYNLKAGESITPEPAPTKDGYTFSGWSEIPESMPEHDVTITGSFSKNNAGQVVEINGVCYYLYKDNTAAVSTHPNKYKGNVVIAESFEYDGVIYTVRAISHRKNQDGMSIPIWAFQYCDELTSISIPKTIKNIDFRSCEGCTNLEAIYITDLEAWCDIDYNITTQTHNFQSASPLGSAHYLYLNGEKITDLVIPESIIDIKPCVFMGGYFKTITLHKNIQTLASLCFAGNDELTDLYSYSPLLLSSTKYDSSRGAFSKPSADATLHFRERYKENYLNRGCLQNLFKNYAYIEGVDFKLSYIVDGELYKESLLEEGEKITPETEPSKDGYTFSGWSEIPETMPGHDVTISGSFSPNIYKLTYYVDGEEYKVVDVKYDETIIPENNPTRKGMTFSGWNDIPEKMPANDVSVTGSFKWSELVLDKVKYQVTDTINNSAAVIGNEDASGEIIIVSDVEFDYSYKVTAVAEKAFYECKDITKVEIPECISNIGERAFANIDKLNDVILHAENVPETDRTAFENSYLDYVTLHVPYGAVDKYKSEGPWKNFKEIVAIEGTQRMYTLTYLVDGDVYKSYEVKEGETIIPETEPVKEGYSFSGWSEIPETMPSEDVVIIGTFTQIEYDVDGSKYVIDDDEATIVDGGNAEGEVMIDATITINGKTYKVTVIGEGAYKGNDKITSVDIPEGIETILANAFFNCSGINILKIGKTIKHIGSKAFGNIWTSAVGTRASDNPLIIECHAETVPDADADCFEGTSIANAVLLVDDSLVESYKAVVPWCYFGEIKGFNEVSGIDAIFAVQQKTVIYSIDGQRLDLPRKGVNIIKTNQGARKMIVK